MSLKELGKALGHTSERTTRVYDHTGADRERKVADKLPSLMFVVDTAVPHEQGNAHE